jgi:hypothetical protein
MVASEASVSFTLKTQDDLTALSVISRHAGQCSFLHVICCTWEMGLIKQSKCSLWYMTWSGTRDIVHLATIRSDKRIVSSGVARSTMTLAQGSVCQVSSLVLVRPFAPHAHLGSISYLGRSPFSLTS